MGKEGWSMAVTICHSCKSTAASLFCKADSALLCVACDGKVHGANKLASRHARVWMCDVCEQAPASVTCKADAAALCVACDRDIHSANPLARRHERFPVVPFYDTATALSKIGGRADNNGDDDDHYFPDFDVNDGRTEAEEAEAASWLLPNPSLNKTDGNEDDNLKVTESESEYLFNDIDPYLDIDLKTPDEKPHQMLRRYSSPTDGVVPVQNENNNHQYRMPHAQAASDVVDGLPAYDLDYTRSKPFMYNFTCQSISQSVSSSSLEMEVGVVPDHSAATADVSNNNHNPHHQSLSEVYPSPVKGFNREARVLRYREKRKNRKFEKTIRYASRKAYAETRPRIKGRFAKRSEIDAEVDDPLITPDSSYGVVPSY